MVKCTFGTGCFMLQNTGDTPFDPIRLLTTVAWGIGGAIEYALEGSMLMAGAVVQWLRDELQIIRSSAEVEALAESVPEFRRERRTWCRRSLGPRTTLGPVCARGNLRDYTGD